MDVVSTFSGAGGSSLGLKQAGFQVPVALEFVESAAAAYRLNAPKTFVFEDDIRVADPAAIMAAAGVSVGELDVFEGSPPCDTFSMSGLRDKGWGITKEYHEGKKQRVDDLAFVFVSLAAAVKPRAILMENVEGLTRGKARAYLNAIIRKVRAAGYQRVDARIYNGADYGLPQRRRRLVLVALRDDVAGTYSPPEVTHPSGAWVTIGQALEGVPDPCPEERAKIMDPNTKAARLWASTPPGKNFDAAHRALYRGNAFFNNARGAFDQVSNCIAATPVLCHPAESRLYHIPELRRLGGFPDDFKLTGSHGVRWRRIGMSVAPPMYRAIGERLGDALATGP